MDCQSMIRQLPDAWHEKIREHECLKSLLHKGFQLHECYTNKDAVTQLYENLSNSEKELLRLITSRIGNRPFKQQDIVNCAASLMKSSISPAELLVGLVKLRQKAIVFTLRTSWGEAQYVLPNDTFYIWHQLALKSNERHVEKQDENEDINVQVKERTESASLADNMFRFLFQLTTLKLEKTKSGWWNKRQRSVFEQNMTLDQHLIGEEPFEYIVELAQQFNLIRLHTDGATAVKNSIEQWLKQPMTNIHHQLYEAHRNRSSLIKELLTMHFVYWCEAQQSWFLIDDFWRWLGKIEMQEAINEQVKVVIQASIEQWLNELHHLDWIETGIGKQNGKRYYRFLLNQFHHRSSFQADEIIIKPDFEMFLPASASYSVRWLVESAAEKSREDVVITYELTKKGVEHALNRGITISDWIENVKRYAKKGIPENVLHTLLEWERSCEQGQKEESITIRNERNVVEESSENQKKGSVQLKIDIKYPELEDIYPGLQQIPSMWLNEIRSYHPSTSKAIMEKALQWRAQVRCAMEDDEFLFIPEKFQTSRRQEWAVFGKKRFGEQQVLHGKALRKLQLILPGVNEMKS